MTLSTLPAHWFERTGLFMSVLGCAAIGAQVTREWTDGHASTLSWTFLLSSLTLYVFWTLYGLRFSRPAIWIGNVVAAALQVSLMAIVALK